MPPTFEIELPHSQPAFVALHQSDVRDLVLVCVVVCSCVAFDDETRRRAD